MLLLKKTRPFASWGEARNGAHLINEPRGTRAVERKRERKDDGHIGVILKPSPRLWDDRNGRVDVCLPRYSISSRISTSLDDRIGTA